MHLNWSSLQLNVGTISEWHADSANIGDTFIMVDGDFSGGEFQMQGLPKLQLAGHGLIFDASMEHRSRPFYGQRMSVVAFRHPAAFALTSQERGRLKALGFVLDDPAAAIHPTRIGWNPERLSDPRVLYIGRGSSQHGLQNSYWCNEHNVSHSTREKAIEAFRKDLWADSARLDRVRELEGRTLMCHCTEHEACHGKFCWTRSPSG